MAWIEGYKTKGLRYYRYMETGANPVHLGSAESIFRKCKGYGPAERKERAEAPTNSQEGDRAATHEEGDQASKGRVYE